VTTTFAVEVRHQFDDDLAGEWSALLLESGSTLPFHHQDFIAAAVEMSADQATPYLILVRATSGRLVAALPLSASTVRWGVVRQRTLLAASDRRYDLTKLLASPEHVEGAAAAVLAHLEEQRRIGWTMAVNRVPADDPLLSVARPGFTTSRPQSIRTASLCGAKTWEEVIRDGHQRREIGRCWRRLEREHGAVVNWSDSAEPVDSAVGSLARLHSELQTARGRPEGSLASSSAQAGLTHLLRQWVPRGLADIGLLTTNGNEVIAGYVLLHHADRTWAYRTAHARAWRRHAPGAVLLAAAVNRSIMRGSHWYDLGCGDEPYKEPWSEVIGTASRWQATPPRWRRVAPHAARRLGIPSRITPYHP
jgi:CelD/BcsL family acetyltransferase involved in cellulose biosynthesis